MVELIDVKERKVECLIEGNGEKTVVIMPGMGCSIYDWMDIAHEVSQHAKVIAVHRPGVGNSEPHAEGSNTLIASEDLQDLLLKLGVEGKVILVIPMADCACNILQGFIRKRWKACCL